MLGKLVVGLLTGGNGVDDGSVWIGIGVDGSFAVRSLSLNFFVDGFCVFDGFGGGIGGFEGIGEAGGEFFDGLEEYDACIYSIVVGYRLCGNFVNSCFGIGVECV